MNRRKIIRLKPLFNFTYMEKSRLDEIEKFIDEKINTKFTLIDRLLDEKVNSKFSLSIKYWYPTIITVVVATCSAVWWFRGQIKPLEDQITIINNRGSLVRDTRNQPITSIKYLLDLKNEEDFDADDVRLMEDIAYILNNQRKDLVIIIAGYTGKNETSAKSKQMHDSELIAKKIANFFIKRDISADRIFCRGHGPDTPDYYSKDEPLNACLMLCDVFRLMAIEVQG